MKTSITLRFLYLLSMILAPLAVAAQGALPEPFIHYKFQDSGTVAVNSGTAGAAFNQILSINTRDSINLPPPSFGAVSGGPFGATPYLDFGNATAMGNGYAPQSTLAANTAAHGTLDSMTITGWFRTDADLPATNQNVTIMRAYVNSPKHGWNLIFPDASGKLRLNMVAATARNFESSAAFTSGTGVWQFFAVAWSSTGGAQWYAGTEALAPVASGSNTTAFSYDGSAAGTVIPLQIGAQSNQSAGGAFKGRFADLRVYSSVLTSAQVASVYDAAKPVVASSEPVITGFAPSQISIGGTVTITGSNFTNSGTSVVTDILFGTISTGAANFTVDSDTQITVASVPSGITAGGNISVLATSGTAVSSGTFSLEGSLPAPLAHYTFEESGTTVTSILNNGALGADFNLTAIGADARIGLDGSGVNAKGKALDLTGNASMNVNAATAYAATSAAKAGLDNLPAMTVTGWIKPTVALSSPAGAMLMRYSDGSGGAINGWNMSVQSSDRIGFSVGNASQTTYSSPNNTFNAGANQWQFFAITWSGTGGGKWYAGTEVGAPILSGTNPATATMAQKNQVLRIGYAGANNGFKGLMDDIRVYGQELTAAQIKAVYDSARSESFANELPFPAAWEGDADARRLATRTTYLKLVERIIADGATPHILRISNVYDSGTALSRFSLYYAYAQAYRASLAPADITGPAKSIRDGYIENGRKAIIAITNAITSADPAIVKSQAAEQAGAQGATVQLYRLLVELGVFNAAEQGDIEQKLGTAASAIIDPAIHNPEYGSFNRSASAAAGLAATANLPTLSADARRASWLAYANAVWNDWMHVGDTFEDARGYNGLWIYATFMQADEMGPAYLDAMRGMAPAAALGRFASMSAPNGVIPDYGNCYWDHGLGFWLYASERLGSFYGRADFLENATRLADFVERNPGMDLGDYDGFIEACRAVAATPADTTITRPDALATTRTTDYGDTTPDKLYLRTGNDPATSAYAVLDLHSHGYHGHEDSAAILTYTSGSSVLLHSLGRLDTFANQAQTAWAVPQGRDILDTQNRHAANTWTRWLVNHRFPGTYTGGPVIDIAKISTLFFRVQNDGDDTITLTVDVESVTGVKADGTTAQVAGPWTLTRTLAPGEAAFASTTTFSPALDLSPYEYVLVKWKSTHPDYTQQFGFNGASLNPTGSPDGRPATATLRTTAGASVIDSYAISDTTAPKAGFTRIMLDSAGRQIVHNRDLRMRKSDGALFVLDSFEFTEGGSYTVGPIWHAQNIVSQTATTVITRDDAQIDTATSQAAEPRMPLRFDFAATDNAGAVTIVSSTYAASRNAQTNHFAATASGAYAAGDVVSILSILRPGTIDTNDTVPDAPSLVAVGARYANYADATGQLSIGDAPPPPPAITEFTPEAITIGGAVSISGYNFTNEVTGTSLVTNVTFGDVATGAAGFVVNSGTSITVNSVPAGIPASGYVKVLATSGTAVSTGVYTIAAAPAVPVTPSVPAGSAEGDNIVLTASATGNPAPTYTWEYSTDGGVSWLAIADLGAANYTLSADGATLTLKSVTDAMQGRQFRYAANNGIGSAITSSPVTLAFTPAPPSISVFDPLALTVGGTMRIYGSNFIKSGSSVVTGIQIGGVAAGADTWIVNSGTLITVGPIPSTVPESGQISVLATTGTAVSSGTYTLAPDPSTIHPVVHFDFQNVVSGTVPNIGTLGADMNLTFATGIAGVNASVTRDGTGPNGNGVALDLSNAAGMGIQGPRAATRANNNLVKQQPALTFTGWFKPGKDATKPDFNAILLRNTGATGSGGGFILRFFSGIADATKVGLQFTLQDSANAATDFKSETDKYFFAAGKPKWQFFAVTWHPETGVKFYQGAEKNDVPVQLAGSSTVQKQMGPDPSNSGAFIVGAGGSSNVFKGYLADVRVYGEVLTDEHIELIRQEAIAGAGVPDALVRYTFDADSDSAVAAVNLGTLLGDYDMPFAGSAKVTPAGTGVGGYGRALDLSANGAFNGAAAAYVETPEAKSGISTQSALTISGWFKPNAALAPGGVIFRNAGAPDAGTGWSVTTNTNNRLTLTIGNGSGQVSYSSSDNAYNAGAGKWQFFSVTWDKTTGATWYAGAEKTVPIEVGATAAAAALPDAAVAQTLRIGRADSASGSFAGQLDDLRVYEGAFTADQIQTIYKQAVLEPADDENSLDTPGSWAGDTDTRRGAARQAYVGILDREIAAQSSAQLVAIEAAYRDGAALSATAISYAYAQAYRAYIAGDDTPGAARQIRANYIDGARRALLAVTNAIAGPQAKQQADELVAGLAPLVSLYHMLVDLHVFDAGTQGALEQKLALCATAVLTNRTATPTVPDYGSQHRAASTAAGVAAVAAIPSLSTHSDRDTLWLKYANAVWSDWKHDSVAGTFEDSRGGNGKWLYSTLKQADALGAAHVAELSDANVKTVFSGHVHAVSPGGAMPDYGSSNWADGLGSWLYAFERLGRAYARPDLTENATRLSVFVTRNTALVVTDLEGIVDALRVVDATPSGAITRPDVVATTRTTDFGDTLHDKLYFRTGTATNAKYAAFDLHDHGYNGGNDAGSLILLTGTNGASITLHTLGRASSDAASLQQNAAAVPSGRDILATTGRHVANEWTRWLVNFPHPGNYAGRAVLNPAGVTSLFFRLENKGPAQVTADVTVESVVGVKSDGAATTLHAGWSGSQSLAPGAVASVTANVTLDLTPYQYVLVKWKSAQPGCVASFGFDGAAFFPAGTADGRPATATLLASAGSHVLDAYATGDADAAKGGLTRIILDTSGRQISHTRDIRHRKSDGALLVLDSYEFVESGGYTVGPVWHAQNIVSTGSTTVSGVPVLSVVTRDDAQAVSASGTVAEAVAPLRFDFAATGTATPVALARATSAAGGNPQQEHFAATVTGDYAAGEIVSILSVLRAGVVGTTGTAAGNVSPVPVLMQVGDAQGANFADAASQLGIGLNPPVAAPAIASFTPREVTIGTPLTIKGYNLDTVEHLLIGDQPAAFIIDSGTQITVPSIPDGIASVGYIYLYATNGNAVSTTQYSIARPVTISVFPETFQVADGHATMLSVVVDANPPATYQWQTSADGGVTWTNIAGATASTYGITAATASMNGTLYRVIVTNVTGSVTNTVTSEAAALVVNPAQQKTPAGLVLDAAGNIYVADYGDHVIRQIDGNGDVTILSGSVGVSGNLNGHGSGARFNSPAGITISATTGKLYVADRGNHTIRELAASGVANLFAGSAGQANYSDGAAGNARFNTPYGIASDTTGNLYIADSLNHIIRKVTPGGAVSTIAGTPKVSGTSDGAAADATFNTPRGIAVYRDGSIYVADTLNHTIREITTDGQVRTLAGLAAVTGTDDGAGTLARFNMPHGMTIGGDGLLYVADTENSLIREIDIETGIVATLAGRARVIGQLDGIPGVGTLNKPQGIALGADGLLYIADSGNGAIRVIDENDNLVTLSITGTATLPQPEPAPDRGGGTGENSGGGASSAWLFAAMTALVSFRFMRRHTALFTIIAGFTCIGFLNTDACAQQPATGIVQGQVLNTATAEYLYQARVRITAVSTGELPRQNETLTDSEGFYRFTGVPAGVITLEASYTGMLPRSTTVELDSSGFVVAGTIQMSMAAPAVVKDDVVHLERYVVSSSREMAGAAIAQNSQRYATNIKNVVSVDELGFTGDGSIAGAIKFLAGVELEQDDYGFGNAITLSGAPSANVPVTIGGFDTVTSSDLVQNTTNSGNQRSVNLAQLSLNSVSRIEVNRSPTPDMPGSALAGSVNIVPKNAFERVRPLYTLKLFASANTKSISLNRYSAPLGGTHIPSRPNAVFNAIVPVNKHFGFSLTLSHNEIPASGSKVERISTANWDKSTNNFIDTPSNPEHYMLYSFEVQDILSLQTKDGVNLTFDYKLSRVDTISLGFNQNYNVLKSGQRRAVWQLDTQILDLHNSTVTNVQNIPGTSTNRGQIRNETYNNDTSDSNRQFQLKYRHNGRFWKADFGASYGEAEKQMRDFERNHLFSSALYLNGSTIKINDIGAWDVGRITGDYHGIPVSPLDIGSYLDAGAIAKTYVDENGANVNVLTSLPDFRVKPFNTSDKKTQLFGNIGRDVLIGNTYHILKIGFDYTQWKRDQRYNAAIGTGGGFIYNGTDMPYDQFLDTGYNRVLPMNYGKIASWDSEKMGRFFNENRDLFVQANDANDFVTAVNNSKYIEETITAGYLRMDSEFFNKRLQLTYGIRFERTKDDGSGVRYDPSAILYQPDPEENPNQWTVLPEYAGKANALITKRAQYSERAAKASRSYDNWFPSINANYTLLENLIARASYSQTVGRPDTYVIVPYLQMPDLSADTETNTFTGGNPGLKPWHSQNVSLSLELYTGSIGSITLRGFRRWIKDAYYLGAMNQADATDLLASYGVDINQYRNPVVRSYQTIGGTVVTSGLELSANYNLDALLPQWAKGFQVRASVVRNTMTSDDPNASSAMSAQKMYLYPWSVAGRLSYTRKFFTVGISAKWNDTLRQAYWSPDLSTYANTTIPGSNITQGSAYEPGTYDYLYRILLVDLDITINLTKKISLYLNARNINGSDQKYLRAGPNTPDLLKNYRRLKYESVWSAGMNITF